MFSAPVPELIALMPSTPPVVVDALIVRIARAIGRRYSSYNASTSSACSSTRCCDVQCARTVIERNNAVFTAGRGGRVNRNRSAGGRVICINTIIPGTTVVVPVVVMLSAPEPSLSASMPSLPPVVVAALIVREVPAEELFA